MSETDSSKKPALRDGLSLKRYMEDAEPTELHSLLLHILERIHELEMKTTALADWRTWLKHTLKIKEKS